MPQKKRSSRHPKRSQKWVRNENPVETIGDYGISIYRRVYDISFYEVNRHIEQICGDNLLRLRGGYGVRPPAFDILGRKDSQEFNIGRLAVQTVCNMLHNNVPSLSSAFDVSVDNFELFGSVTTGDKVLAITIEQEDIDRLNEEKQQVQEVLAELGGCAIENTQPQNFYLQIARVSPYITKRAINNVTYVVKEELPKQLRVQKAILYKP